MRFAFVLGTLALATLSAQAQVTAIGPFTGSDQEGFETQTPGMFSPCLIGRIFNNQGDFCTPSGSAAHVTSSWGFACSIPKRSGKYFGGETSGAGAGGVDLTFDMPISRFGGYFGMNHTGNPDFSVTFYAGPTLVAGPILVPQAVDCQWYWSGWDMSGLGVDRINFKNNYSATATGYLMFDDLEVDFKPACTTVLGPGCPGTGGFIPDLSSTCAVKGQQVSLTIANGLGGSLCGLMLSPVQVNVPIGPTSCSLYVGSPNILIFLPLGGVGPGNGSVMLNTTVPATAPTVSVYLEVFVADPAGPIGLSASNGLAIHIQ